MGKDKKHHRKNSNNQSDTSDEENITRRMHETSLASSSPHHNNRPHNPSSPSQDEPEREVHSGPHQSSRGDNASGYRQVLPEVRRHPEERLQRRYEYPDASRNASQQRYEPRQSCEELGRQNSDEQFFAYENEPHERPGQSQRSNASQPRYEPRQSYGETRQPRYDEETRNNASFGSGTSENENYASQRRYEPRQPRHNEESRDNATFGSGMSEYEVRSQVYGHSQQNESRPQRTSYQPSVSPARNEAPRQPMPQNSRCQQSPYRYDETAEGRYSEMHDSDRDQMQVESPGKAGSIPPPNSSIIGPFVRFTTVDLNEGEHGTWTGSVLIVTGTSGSTPSMEIVAEAGDDRPFRLPASNPVPLDAHQDQTFWRFEVRIPLLRDLEQTVSTRIAFGGERRAEARFSVAGSTTPLRMAFYSCNGVSSDCTDVDIWKSPDSLWDDVLAKHEAKPFHFMIGGGDQIYCDPVWTDVAECKDWIAKSVPNRIQSSFPEQAKTNVEKFYFDNYRKLFNSGKYSQGLRAIPSIMVIDDHDIFDGVGTYPENLRSCPFMWGVALVGYRFFLLFQQHTTPAHSGEHGFFGAEGSHNFVAQLNKEIAAVGVDGRRERRLDQILHLDSYGMMNERLNRLAPSTRHLLAVLGVPILYPRLTIAENILQCVNGINSKLAAMTFLQKAGAFQAIMGPLGDQPELMDDLGDHWTAPTHETERLRFIEQMQTFACNRSIRVTFVSGDVHCCGVGRFKGTSEAALADIKKDPYFMLQVISSAIQNVPPPAMVISALHKCSSRINVNSSSDEDMVDLFGRDAVGNKSLSGYHKLLNRRNWSTIDQDDSGNVKFKIRVEAYSGSGKIGGVYGVVAPPLEL